MSSKRIRVLNKKTARSKATEYKKNKSPKADKIARQRSTTTKLKKIARA